MERVRDRTKANPNARGTSNGNERGNSVVRRERKQWLIDNYPSDMRAIRVTYADEPMRHLATSLIGEQVVMFPKPENFGSVLGLQQRVMDVHRYIVDIEVLPCTRCFHCGTPLTIETVTVDRIKPGCLGGKYRTPKMDTREGVTNVRPACAQHNSSLGGAMANSKALKPAKKRALRSVK